MSQVFEWDSDKAKSNIKKHGVSFELAMRAFADPYVLLKQDRFEHGEYRWQAMGLIDDSLMLLVAHTVNSSPEEEIIRIISARKATKQERKDYEQNRKTYR